MMPDLFGGTPIPALQEVLSFTHARHDVLATNIANLDTPGYRTRDLSLDKFQELLRESLAARRAGSSPGLVDAEGKVLARPSERIAGLLRHDESNVGLEQQVTSIAANQMLHGMAVAIMNNQFRLLQAAIAERV